MKIEQLKTYQDDLYTSISKELSEFERIFFLISSSLFTFSIAFIQNIVAIPDAIFLSLLVCSWVLWAISTFLIMLTFIQSARISDNLWKNIDAKIIAYKLYDKTKDIEEAIANEIQTSTSGLFLKGKNTLYKIRITSISIFLLGCLTMSFFVFFNMYNAKEKTVVEKSPMKIDIELNHNKHKNKQYEKACIKNCEKKSHCEKETCEKEACKEKGCTKKEKVTKKEKRGS